MLNWLFVLNGFKISTFNFLLHFILFSFSFSFLFFLHFYTFKITAIQINVIMQIFNGRKKFRKKNGRMVSRDSTLQHGSQISYQLLKNHEIQLTTFSHFIRFNNLSAQLFNFLFTTGVVLTLKCSLSSDCSICAIVSLRVIVRN